MAFFYDLLFQDSLQPLAPTSTKEAHSKNIEHLKMFPVLTL